MTPIHRPQHGVRTGLDRQMQERHDLSKIAMGGDKIIAHVARMACHVTQARQTIDACELSQKFRKRPYLPVRTLAAISIDVLAQEREFTGATRDKTHRFFLDLRDT